MKIIKVESCYGCPFISRMPKLGVPDILSPYYCEKIKTKVSEHWYNFTIHKDCKLEDLKV